jgi:hypothetical protein
MSLIEIWTRPNYGADSIGGIEHRPQRIDLGRILKNRAEAHMWIEVNGVRTEVYIVRQEPRAEVKWVWNERQGWHVSQFQTRYVPQGTRAAAAAVIPKMYRRPAWAAAFMPK